MSEIQIIMFIFAGTFALWQVALCVAWVVMMASGKYSNVTLGIAPGVLAVILAIVAVLI